MKPTSVEFNSIFVLTVHCFHCYRLTGEHELLDKEFQRQPKKEELEQHIKELSKSVDELNDEISLVRNIRIA